MAFTKAMSRAALAYVLDFDTDHVATAFEQNGITTIWDLLGMTYDDIETLTYEDDQGGTVAITKGDKGRIRCLKCYNLHMEQEGNKIIGDDWPKADASDGEWDTPLHYLWLVIPKTLISSAQTRATTIKSSLHPSATHLERSE